jgi:hypothetical protein
MIILQDSGHGSADINAEALPRVPHGRKPLSRGHGCTVIAGGTRMGPLPPVASATRHRRDLHLLGRSWPSQRRSRYRSVASGVTRVVACKHVEVAQAQCLPCCDCPRGGGRSGRLARLGALHRGTIRRAPLDVLGGKARGTDRRLRLWFPHLEADLYADGRTSRDGSRLAARLHSPPETLPRNAPVPGTDDADRQGRYLRGHPSDGAGRPRVGGSQRHLAARDDRAPAQLYSTLDRCPSSG